MSPERLISIVKTWEQGGSLVVGIPKEARETLGIRRGDKLKVSLDMEKLRLLKHVASTEDLTLEASEGADELALTLKGQYTRRMTLPLLQPSLASLPEPKVEYTAEITLDADALKVVIADMEAAGSSGVRFTADEDSLEFEGIGSDWSSATGQLEKESPLVLDYKVKVRETPGANGSVERQPTSALYTIGMLKDLVAAFTSVVVLNYATDKPLKLSDSNTPSRVTYHLAPRLE